MASLHALHNNSTPLATMQVSADSGDNNHANVNHGHKWTFLVANHIRFTDKPLYCVRVTKPKQHRLSQWLEKIVTGGQCSNLFVEHLSLDEVSFKRLKQLCIEYNVALVNLMPNIESKANVVQGPW